MYKPYLHALGIYLLELSNAIPILLAYCYTVPMDDGKGATAETVNASMTASAPLCLLHANDSSINDVTLGIDDAENGPEVNGLTVT